VTGAVIVHVGCGLETPGSAPCRFEAPSPSAFDDIRLAYDTLAGWQQQALCTDRCFLRSAKVVRARGDKEPREVVL
jgi:hypothetical protein